jgi:hypothetical protein
VVVETSTLPVAVKRRARDALAERGAVLLADQLADTGLDLADAELIAGRNAAALFGVPGRPAVRW